MRLEIVHPPDPETTRHRALALITRDIATRLIEARTLDQCATPRDRADLTRLAARIVTMIDPERHTQAVDAANRAGAKLLVQALGQAQRAAEDPRAVTPIHVVTRATQQGFLDILEAYDGALDAAAADLITGGR